MYSITFAPAFSKPPPLIQRFETFMTARPLNISQALRTLPTRPWIIAHRGDWRSLPENSLAAILSAYDLGADMVEIDVQSIADGTLIVIHDDELDRTTNVSGQVQDLSAGDLADIRLKARDGGEANPATDLPLPRLAEVLEAVRGKGLINIDTKHRRDLDSACALVLSMNMQNQVLMKMIVREDDDGSDFISRSWFGKVPFMPVILDAPKGGLRKRVTQIAKTTSAPIVEILFEDEGELSQLSSELGTMNVGIWTNTLDPVHSLHFSDSRALKDPEGVWGRLHQLGVRAFQTDHPRDLDVFWRGRPG